MRLPATALLSFALIVLTGCIAKASQADLVGYWSIDEKSLETMSASIDPKANDMGASMARMFVQMAAKGIALEFTDTTLRQIQNGAPSPANAYTVGADEGDHITISIGKETFTYVFVGKDRMETTLPGGKMVFRLNKMNVAQIETLKQKMELAASGPTDAAPPAERIGWLVSAQADKADQYLKKYPDVISLKNAQGETALHLAASSQKLQLVKRLIEAGADKTAKDDKGLTPFHRSIMFRFNAELAQVLYTDAINLNAPYRGKGTLLEDALRKPDLAKAAFLCEHGAAPDEGKAAGEKTLFLSAVEHGDLPTVKLLLKHGANINHRLFATEQSALHVAAQYGSLEMIQFLLAQGMSATIQDKDKRTPINCIRYRENDKIEAVRLLVKAGADINEGSISTGTLLSHAIERSDPEFAKALVADGADFDGKIAGSRSAYETAKVHGNTELLALMDARRVAATPGK
jgi:ankyrin repeat protein